MYNKIVNPRTGRLVSIYGRIGKQVIKNYLNYIGGAAQSRADKESQRMADKWEAEEQCDGCEMGSESAAAHTCHNALLIADKQRMADEKSQRMADMWEAEEQCYGCEMGSESASVHTCHNASLMTDKQRMADEKSQRMADMWEAEEHCHGCEMGSESAAAHTCHR